MALFPEEHAFMLKAWIVKRLENTSDAEPDVLADYVLALLRHPGKEEEVRALCDQEIPDFLKEDQSGFIDDVFQTIHYRSYLPGAPPPPKKKTTTKQAAHEAGPPPSAAPARAPLAPSAPSAPSVSSTSFPQNGARKRSIRDWDKPDLHDGDERHPMRRERQRKQLRRGGAGGGGGVSARNHAEQPNGPLGAPAGPRNSHPNNAQHNGPMGAPAGPRNHINPPQSLTPATPFGQPDGSHNFPPAQMALPNPFMTGFQPHNGQQGREGRRPRCRNYDKTGICARGSTCMYEHSDIPDLPSAMPFPTGPPSVPALPAAPARPGEEYDPKNANFLFPHVDGQNLLPMPMPFPLLPDGSFNMAFPGLSQTTKPVRGWRRAAYSAEGPVHDRSKTAIVVESIPEENFSEDQVRAFFSQFGQVMEVSMRAYKRLAIVKFDSWDKANAAYRSPRSVFDNRFVKVYWYTGDDVHNPPTDPSQGHATQAKSDAPNGLGKTEPAVKKDEGLDMEAISREQAEAQKRWEEKEAKRQELKRQQEELEKKQRDNAQTLAAIKAKLGHKAGPSKEDPEDPRAVLARLQAEAVELGLDPHDTASMMDEPLPSLWPPRGGRGRGRGRGFRRARGWAPRGGRGGPYRAGVNNAVYAQYSLDNRPKKVLVTGVDFTASEKNELLRQHLFTIGDFTEIQTSETVTEITFKDRRTAEKFLHGSNGNQIPGIEGVVEVAWVGGSSSGTPSSTPARFFPTAAAKPAEDLPMLDRPVDTPANRDEGKVDQEDEQHLSSDDKDVDIVLDRPADRAELDYDVADW